MNADRELSELLQAELADYMSDEPDGWVSQASRQVVAAIRLAGWSPSNHPIPAEEEREGIR